MIYKDCLVEAKGIVASHHVVQDITFTAPFQTALVNVHSFASEAAFLAGANLIWSTPVSIPATEIHGDILSFVEARLVAYTDSPFFGGQIVADQSNTLAAAKERAWTGIKVARAVAESSDFMYDGGYYQADKARITGAVQLAVLAKMNSQPYTVTWTLTDNTTRTLSADQMIAMGIALGKHVDGVFSLGRAFRARINAATTIEEASAVVWTDAGVANA